jgi:hypothetical protein
MVNLPNHVSTETTEGKLVVQHPNIRGTRVLQETGTILAEFCPNPANVVRPPGLTEGLDTFQPEASYFTRFDVKF